MVAAPPLLVLDHNFPISTIPLPRLPGLAIRPLKDVHPDLIRDHEDWEVMRELRIRDGWITLDAEMPNLAQELVVLHQTRLSLVVFENIQNDPLAAAGMLMIHGRTIARQIDRRRPQLWILPKPPTTQAVNPWSRISAIAGRHDISARALYERYRLPSNLFLRHPAR